MSTAESIPATDALLGFPMGVAVDSSGNVFMSLLGDCKIRRVDAVTGQISTYAGSGTCGYSGNGGPATAAAISSPMGIAVDANDDVYVVQAFCAVRRISSATGVISTVAGTGSCQPVGDGGQATSTSLYYPEGVAVDSAGNLYIAETEFLKVRRVDAATGVITTFAGTGMGGPPGDGGPATLANLLGPRRIAIDEAGDVYFLDVATFAGNGRVRRVDVVSGIISTIAGGGGGTGESGLAVNAYLGSAVDLAIRDGHLYIAGQNRVWVVELPTNQISVFAGTGGFGDSGDGGEASLAQFMGLGGVAVASNWHVYISDRNAGRVRKVAACESDVDCDDSTLCTDDSCNLSTHFCEFTSNVSSGQCCHPLTGLLTPIDDGNECTADSCDAVTGTVSHDSGPLDGASCGDPTDGDCQNPDTCLNGSCQANNEPIDTTCGIDADECTDDVCNGAGICTHPSNVPIGQCCNPMNGALVPIDDANSCTADSCDAGVGSVTHQPLRGAPCTVDANVCTDDICDGTGNCSHPSNVPVGQCCHPITGLLTTIDDGNQCTTDSCDAVTGAVSHESGPLDGASCGDPTDGDCQNPDTCLNGICQSNIEPNGTPCTHDTDDCTVDHCENGICTHPNISTFSCSSDAHCITILDDLGATCSPSGFCQCNFGGCCLADNCMYKTASDCAAAGGIFLGNNVVCLFFCQRGSCCMANGECAGSGNTCSTSAQCVPPETCSGGACLVTASTCMAEPENVFHGNGACNWGRCLTGPYNVCRNDESCQKVCVGGSNHALSCSSGAQCPGGSCTNSGTCDFSTPLIVCPGSSPCSNGELDAGELCDDGNVINGDGCDINCTPTSCGNGVATFGELCDDGNTSDGDGCDSTCRLEYPQNDGCGGLTEVVDGVTVFNLNVAADGGDEPGCHFPDNNTQFYQDLWFSYTASCTGTLSLDTCGLGDFDTRIAVYEGCQCSPVGQPLGCNDNSGAYDEGAYYFDPCTQGGGAPFESGVAVRVISGQCYKIRVGLSTWYAASGTDQLKIACSCGNDIFCPESPPCPSGCDTDGDGLCDDWETNGIDINSDGLIDLVLQGADPNHQDLFVEVDAMLGRAPELATLNLVVSAFAAAPASLVQNPDGLDGINLHLELDDVEIPLESWIAAGPWSAFDATKAAYYGSGAQRNDPNSVYILAAKRKTFRYCVFADKFNAAGNSGIAEVPGDDFMVTLGLFPTPGGTPDQQAGTFMHELGHNLGLWHGGDQPFHNYKPNYRSVMNYIWQFPRSGLPGWELDFSSNSYPTLNELGLDESMGIGGLDGGFTRVCPQPFAIVSEVGPVDWNRDGDATDVTLARDINCDNDHDMLTGYTDWSQLYLRLCGAPSFAEGVHLTPPDGEIDLPTLHNLIQPICVQNVDCDDGTPCTHQTCQNGVCQFTYVVFGDIAPPSNGLVDLDDILCMLSGFANFNQCPNGDIAPTSGAFACRGNDLIDLDDILAVLSAFAGGNPCGCAP